MKRHILLSLLISVGLTTTVACGSGNAGTLNTAPLPHERTDKDYDNSEEMTPPVSRYRHRHDYREEEKAAAADADAKRKQAIENAAKMQKAAVDAVKQRNQASIDANNRGVAMGQQHRWIEAISAHEEAVQLDPRNKQFRINLSAARCAYGQEKLQQGDLNAAATLFRKALAAASDNGLAGKLLVETMKKQGRDPSNVDVRIDIGDQLASLNDLEGATVEYEAAMQLQPNAKTYTKMGDIAMRYGQASTGLNWYRQAIAKDSNYGPAHRQLGMVALNSRDYSTAASELRRALICDSSDGMAAEMLVSIWRKQVANNPLLAENHLGLAGALQLTNDFAGAEQEYAKAQVLDAHNAGIASGRASLQRAMEHAEADKYRAAAETLFSQGLNREALAEMGRAVSMEPRNAKYQFIFGEMLEANNDYQGAHQAYMSCVLLDPEHNAEAAARIKVMQRNLAGKVNFGAPVQQLATSAGPVAGAPLQMPNGAQSPATAMSAAGQAAPPQPRPLTPQEAAAKAKQDALARVKELEGQKSYESAIELLRQIVEHELQNAELHHELGVDLLANGQVTESVTEFRLACALRPDKSDYAADLAQAMAIYKRSQEVAASTGVAK